MFAMDVMMLPSNPSQILELLQLKAVAVWFLAIFHMKKLIVC